MIPRNEHRVPQELMIYHHIIPEKWRCDWYAPFSDGPMVLPSQTLGIEPITGENGKNHSYRTYRLMVYERI